MKALFKNLLLSFSPPEEDPPSEEELLLAEIEATKQKIDYAWNRLDHADPEYVEIAVLEILLAETQYGILNKRYRLMLGLKDETPHFMTSAKALSSLERNCQNHALYRYMLEPKPENSRNKADSSLGSGLSS
ncbi:hypothetical protein [Desulfosporosinus sp.]|uniref:hypothetical protein n=1 Tax=Desulfosporosinus sp. TaxID=157907 RepID=UPI0025C0B2A1|nr:hypothetical protein [Desulfosporosinus sp.]